MSKKVKVCFVGLYTYQLFNPDFKGIFGGSEVRASIIMKELAKDDQFEIVNVVNADPGVVEGVFDGVQVVTHSFYKHDYQGEGVQQLPLLKRILPEKMGYYAYKIQLTLTKRIRPILDKIVYKVSRRGIYGQGHVYIPQKKINVYDRVNADIYCIFGVKNEAYELFSYCEARHKKSLLFLGSDSDLDADYEKSNRLLNRYGSRNDLCYYAISDAGSIITQSLHQQNLLKDRFERDSMLVQNPINLNHTHFSGLSQQERVVLWVGKSHAVKRPEKLIQLASLLPNVRFKMIMNNWDRSFHTEILSKLPPNVSYVESVAFENIEDEFKNSYLFVNTSDFEGFPNTFLQAAKFGIPVVSLNADPNGMFTNHNCGYCAHGDLSSMVDIIREYMQNTELYSETRFRILDYVNTYHNKETIINDIKDIMTTQL